MTAVSSFPTWLQAALDSLAENDLDGWLDMFAQDGVHEFPWAPEGAPRRLVGHEGMRTYMGQLTGRIRFGGYSDVHVYDAGDDMIVQATGHHARPDGTPRDLDYIWFITRQGGKVTRLQDYTNPARVSAH